MARFRKMVATINSTKHIIQIGPVTVALGAIRNESLALATEVGDVLTVTQCRIGAVVKAVYIELWISSDDATQSSVTVTLEKLPDATNNMTAGESSALQDYVNKHNVFYTSQGLTGTNATSGIPFLRGWFKIPKGKQRMTRGSKIVLNVRALTDGLTICGFSTYKEYY